ncbi:MAG TPA: hypothetical protein VFR37_08720 [Longimicrobium sp.]|nr:hypothetical protein [Longimicrobium sp.]
MIIRLPLRSLLVLLAIVLAAGDASAQLEFAGIPWGTPVDSASARIQRAGYAFRGEDQLGDRVFGGPDGMDLVAMFDSTGLVLVEATWMDRPELLPARYERMADSMRRALGAPDTANADEYERFGTWKRGEAVLDLFFRPRGGGLDTALILRHAGPGYEAEYERRDLAWEARGAEERANGTSDTTGVGDWENAFSDFRVMIRVDTTRYTRLAPGLFRARFRHDWMQRRRLENGMLYSAAITFAELDCQAVATRPYRVIRMYDFRALPVVFIRQADRRWVRPAPRSPDDSALRRACEVLGRQP